MTAELERRKQAFEMRWYRRSLNISHKDHITHVDQNKSQTKIKVAYNNYLQSILGLSDEESKSDIEKSNFALKFFSLIKNA